MTGNTEPQGSDAKRVAPAKTMWDHLADNRQIENVAERTAHAIEHRLSYSRSVLDREFGLRPTKDARPASSYKSYYGPRVDLYRVADTVAIKRRSAPPSRAQRINGRITAKRERIRKSDLNRSLNRFAEAWYENRIVVMDTETTCLDSPEIIEIAAVEARSGEVLINERVRPITEIEDGAAAVHGMTSDDLADAPRWPEVAARFHDALPDRALLAAFNAPFDRRAYETTCDLHGVDARPGGWLCVQRDVAKCADPFALRIALADAARDARIPVDEDKAHAALFDAQIAASVLNYWMRVRERNLRWVERAERILDRLKARRWA